MSRYTALAEVKITVKCNSKENLNTTAKRIAYITKTREKQGQ